MEYELVMSIRTGMFAPCIDCKCLPWSIGEDFYVNDKLWKSTVPDNGIICIECFEKRLGRKLTKRDFKPWFRKNRCFGDQRWKLNRHPSQRLKERLGL